MKFFKKMDEMEMYITLKALRFTYIFILVFLMARLVYILVTNDYDPNVAFGSWEFFLLITQNVIYLGAQMIMTKRMGK